MSSLAVPPHIRVHQDSTGRIIVRFHGVEFATDYNVYIDTANPPVTLEIELDSTIDNVGNNTFVHYSEAESTSVFVAVSALDHLGGESALSNVEHIDPIAVVVGDTPTDALMHVRRLNH
jgi:hypothetical protein